jgi:hypothetical protein
VERLRREEQLDQLSTWLLTRSADSGMMLHKAWWSTTKVACRPARRSTLAAPRLVTRARLSDWFGGENYMASKIGNKVDLETRDQVRM